MPHIDIHDLHREKDKRIAVKNEIYDKVLARCHSKIKSISKLSDICFCFFEVPAYIYGLPAYNQIECIYYIVQVLIEDGFKVEFAEPNILFITWYIKPKRKTLADIASQSRMPIHNNHNVKKTTQNYNVKNRLYHDGLSELEMKSDKIFREDLYDPKKQQRNIPKSINQNNYRNNTRNINYGNSNGNSNNNNTRNINYGNNNRNYGNVNQNSNTKNINYSNGNYNHKSIDFNPSKIDKMNSMPTNTKFQNRNTKTFTLDDDNDLSGFNAGKSYPNKVQIKKDGFRSLFDNNGF